MITNPSVLKVSINDTVSISCQANGGPDNVFNWFYNGRDGSLNTSVSTSENLSISMVTFSQSGYYRCVVSNTAGFGEDTTIVYCKLLPCYM